MEVGGLSVSAEDGSSLVFSNRLSTLKLVLTNVSDEPLRDVYLVPPMNPKCVLGEVGDLELMWGGGHVRGYLITLPGDRTVVRPGEGAVAYFLLHTGVRRNEKVEVPLRVYMGEEEVGVLRIPIEVRYGDPRKYIYRPRYHPYVNEAMLSLVKDILLSGLPDVEVRAWPMDPASGLLVPRVEVYFEGEMVARIKGDIGSGFRHIHGIRMVKDLFLGRAFDPIEWRPRWYWVLRLWFLWLDRSLFDEVPDQERVELWINPVTAKVDWLITDEHWREVAYRGPVDYADVRITTTSRRVLKVLGAIGLARSYHPPKVLNMVKERVSPDSRDPKARVVTVWF